MIKRLYIFILLIWSWVGLAQNPSFYSQVSKNKVAVGEVFQVAFTLEGQGSNLTYPSFKDFDVYSGPNQSQSMSIVNGNFSQSTTLSFLLVPKKEGKFVIGSATIVAGNQKLETKPITIEVVKAATQQNASTQGNQRQQQNNQQEATSKEISKDEVFIRAIPSKTKAYKGEQIHLVHKLYSRYQLINFEPKMLHQSFEGFWNQTHEHKGNFNVKNEVVNGITYQVVEIYSTYLFAQRSGKINIDPVNIQALVRKQTRRAPRNIFEQMFGTAGYEDIVVDLKSNPITVDISELPTENKPENFTGAVGNFALKTEVSKDQVKANDAFNLKITINGKGNINLIEPIKLNLPESFEVYDPKVNENISTENTVSGSKTFDYLIIPREKGEFILNQLNFSYFDAAKKEYVTIPSPDIKITVLEGDGTSAQIVKPNKKGVQETDNDIRYIKTGDLNLIKSESEFFSSLTHFMLLLLPVLLFSGGLIVFKKHLRDNSNLSIVKERKAAKMARKQLAKAEKHLNENNKDLFFAETLNAIHEYLENKFGLATVDLSKDKITEILISKGALTDTCKKLTDTIDVCEFAKYAPSAVTSDLQEVYKNTVELISLVEEQIKK